MFRHVIKVVSQCGDFVPSSAQRRTDSGIEFSRRNFTYRALQAQHRRCDVVRKPQANYDPNNDNRRQSEQKLS